MRRKQRRLVKSVLAGMAGGLAGAWTMNQFQAVAAEIQKKQKQRKPQPAAKPQESQDSDDATMKAADRLSRAVAHHPLTKQEKQKLGPVVHYGFGAAMGAFYGALAEVLPAAKAGFGTGFGAALFLLADETAVPALGLSEAPTKYPLRSHAMALASHLVWGTTAEAVRRIAA